MVRTASRTAALNVLRLPSARQHVLSSGFFAEFVTGVCTQLKELDQFIMKEGTFSGIKARVSDELDNLYYLNDILAEDLPEYHEVLQDTVLKEMLLARMAGPLLALKPQSYHLSIPLACCLLANALHIFKDEVVLQAVFRVLFVRRIAPELLSVCIGDETSASVADILHYPATASNPAADVLTSFLKCRDDNLVTLTLSLFHAVLEHTTLKAELGVDSVSLVTQLVQVLLVSPSFRMSTCQSACSLLVKLERPLDSDSAALFRTAYRQTVVDVQSSLEKPYLQSLVLDCLEEEWKRVEALNLQAKSKPNPYALRPLMDEFSASVPLEHRRPYGDVEAIHLATFLFALYGRTYNTLLWTDPIEISEHMAAILHPAKAAGGWELSHTYTLDAKHPFLICSQTTERVPKYFIPDEESFVLAEPHGNQLRHVKVVEIEALRNVETMVRRQEPKCLNVVLRSKASVKELHLVFEDERKCTEAKTVLEHMKAKSKQYTVSLLLSLLETLQTSLVNPL